jgi:hypothetical protein
VAFRVQCGGVRVRRRQFADAGNARLGAAGVVEEELIADRHGPQEIARLIVAHPVPARFAELPRPLIESSSGSDFISQ